MLDIVLDFRIGKLAPDEALGIEDGVARVGVERVLGGLSDSRGATQSVNVKRVERERHLQPILGTKAHP